MIWLYLVVGALTALLVGGLQYYFRNKPQTTLGVTAFAVVVVLLIVKLYGVPYYQAWSFESDLRKESTFFDLLAQKSPQAFKEYIDKTKKDIIHNDSQNVIAYTSELVSSQMTKYGSQATNEAIYNQVKATIDYYNKLDAINPVLVLFLEYPNIFADKLSEKEIESVSEGPENPIPTANQNIIKSALETPQPPLSKADRIKAQMILNKIIETLSTQYGEKKVEMTFQHPDDPALDKKTAAEIIITFYQLLVERGEKDTGLVIRYISSSNR
ncbi:hypothetical protein [Legionella sp. 29fVS95]|uniref:hypothetical protein n=1 Tax=Legionella sp. 29fVS95 TaxID=3402813 RepID=UPI003AF92183